MEDIYINMNVGGYKYGEGAKGSVFDIYKSSDNDKEYFINGNATYNFIDISGDILKTELNILSSNIKEKLKNYLIKVYEKKEYYETEKKLTIQ